MLSVGDYRALTACRPDFRTHLLGGPKVDDFSIERDGDTGEMSIFEYDGRYLLDTNVISETRKVRVVPRVVRFLEETIGERLFLSVLTLGELRKGVAARRQTDGPMADRLTLWVDAIEATFSGSILPLDAAAARIWGEFVGRPKAAGRRYAGRRDGDRAGPYIGYPQHTRRSRDRRPCA